MSANDHSDSRTTNGNQNLTNIDNTNTNSNDNFAQPLRKGNHRHYGACELISSGKKALARGSGTESSGYSSGDLRDVKLRLAGADKPAHGRLLADSRASIPTASNGSPASPQIPQAGAPTLLQRAANRVPGLGIMLAIGASVFLGTAGMLVKVVTSVSGIQVAVLRASIQLAIYGSIIAYRRLPYVPKSGEFIPVMSRALLGGASITFSYYALKLIPLGDATTIRFSLPIWTLIISYLVLKESCSMLKVAAVVVCICGVVLIAKPEECMYVLHLIWKSIGLESETEFQAEANEYEKLREHELAALGETPLNPSEQPYRQLEGCLMALSSSIFLSMSLIALRMCKETPAEITIFWLSVLSILMGSVTLVAINDLRIPNNLMDVLYIALNGLCGSIGQWFITSALKIEQSGVIALARTFDIEVAFLYSAFLLHEEIKVTSIFGSVLVSCGVLAVVIPKWLGSRNSSPEEDLGEGGANEEENNEQLRSVHAHLSAPTKPRAFTDK